MRKHCMRGYSTVHQAAKKLSCKRDRRFPVCRVMYICMHVVSFMTSAISTVDKCLREVAKRLLSSADGPRDLADFRST